MKPLNLVNPKFNQLSTAAKAAKAEPKAEPFLFLEFEHNLLDKLEQLGTTTQAHSVFRALITRTKVERPG